MAAAGQYVADRVETRGLSTYNRAHAVTARRSLPSAISSAPVPQRRSTPPRPALAGDQRDERDIAQSFHPARAVANKDTLPVVTDRADQSCGRGQLPQQRGRQLPG